MPTIRARSWIALTILFLSLHGLKPARAEIFTPGDTVPGLSTEVFTWSENAANSTFAYWDNFGNVGGMSLGGVAPGVMPDPDAKFSDGNPDTTLTFNSFASIISDGNAYGFNFAPGQPPFQPEFITDLSATVRSGTSGGSNTRIVAQWQTRGGELNYDSILLSLSPTNEGTITPDLLVETGRNALGGFGGELVNRMAIWDLDSSQDEYRVDFSALANHVSLDEFRVDTFTQASTFVTPIAVPEPGSFAALGAISAVVFLKRRRRAGRRHLKRS